MRTATLQQFEQASTALLRLLAAAQVAEDRLTRTARDETDINALKKLRLAIAEAKEQQQ